MNQRATVAARSNLLTQPLIAAAGLASSVIVVRALAPADFALFALAIALRATIVFLADMGTGAASTRLFAQLQALGARAAARRALARLVVIRFGLVALLALVVVSAPGAVAGVLGLRGDEHWVLVFIVLIGGFEMLGSLGLNTLVGLFGHPAVNRVLLIQSVGQPVLVIAAAAAGLGLRGILGAVVAGSAWKGIALGVMAVRATHAIHDTGAAGPARMAATYTKVATSTLAAKTSGWLHSRQVVTVIAMSSVSRPAVAVFSLAYDLVHQVLTVVSAPFYNLMLATFSSRQDSDERLLRLVVRGLALVALPLAVALLATFSSMSAVLFGPEYSDTVQYAAIIVPAFALEVILSGPAGALMTARESMVGTFGRIKALTCIGAVAYLVTAGTHLLLVTGLMMGIRLASTAALHVALWRRMRIRVEAGWLLGLIAIAVVSGLAGYAAGAALPGRVADLVVVPVTCLALFLVLVRVFRMLRADDAALADRILPVGRRALRALAGLPAPAPSHSGAGI